VKGLHSPVSKLKFLSDKNIVVIGTREGEVIFYSLYGEGEVLFVDENEHSGRVNCIHYNFENNLIITGGNDKVINVWELAVLADRVLKERQYSPIKFLEKLPVQDIQFVNSSWFMTVTRGTSIGEGEGRVSMWSIKVDELERELNDLVSRNTFKASEIDVKKYTEN
jgi:WD40 repeat protein